MGMFLALLPPVHTGIWPPENDPVTYLYITLCTMERSTPQEGNPPWSSPASISRGVRAGLMRMEPIVLVPLEKGTDDWTRVPLAVGSVSVSLVR